MSKTWTGEVECRICGATHKAVIEIEDGQDEPVIPLECVSCANIACYAVDECFPGDDYKHEDWTS